MTLKDAFKTVLVDPLRRVLSPLIVPAIDHSLHKDSRDIERWRRRKALEEAGRFVEEHMSALQSDPDDLSLLTRAIEQIKPGGNGLVCEFGVASGRTLNHIATKLCDRIVFGFDCFTGLPEDWRDGLPAGAFARPGPPRVRGNARLVEGLFADTLPGFLEANSGMMEFVHVDCDLYSSTRTVLDLCRERIGPGCILVFDEYFNYPGWREGEYKAFMEFVDAAGLSFEYIGYCRYNSQVAVKIVAQAE